MSSLFFGIVLFLYCLLEVTTKSGQNFYVDRVLWCIAWGTLFILNGLFGGAYTQSALTNWLIFTYVMLFVGGHTLVTSFVKGGYAPRLRPVPPLFIFVVVCSAIGMLAPYELVTHGGASVSTLTESSNYGASIASINSDIRNGLVEQSLIGKIAFATPQAALVLVGIFIMVGQYNSKKKALLVAIVFFPLFAYTFVSTVRSPIFLAIILLVSGIVAGMTLLGTEKSLFKGRYVLVGGGIFLALFVMMLFFQSFRLGDYNFTRVGTTLEHMRIWYAGYIPAFNAWLWDFWDGSLTYGASSFRFISGLISGKGSYLDSVYPSFPIGNWQYGNATTFFQLVIKDFGMIGCGVFLFIWGILSGLLITNARRGSYYFAILFACNMAAIIWSPNSSFFAYGSRLLAPMIAITYLLFMQTKFQKSAPHMPSKLHPISHRQNARR